MVQMMACLNDGTLNGVMMFLSIGPLCLMVILICTAVDMNDFEASASLNRMKKPRDTHRKVMK